MSTYGGSNTFPSLITIPDDGDVIDASSVDVPLEGLADRTVYLKTNLAPMTHQMVGIFAFGGTVSPAYDFNTATYDDTLNFGIASIPLADVQSGDLIEFFFSTSLTEVSDGDTSGFIQCRVAWSQVSPDYVTGTFVNANNCEKEVAHDPSIQINAWAMQFACLVVAGAGTEDARFVFQAKSNPAGNYSQLASGIQYGGYWRIWRPISI